MKLFQAMAFLMVICVLACSCCSFRNPLTRKPLDFSGARMSPDHPPIIIDGMRSSSNEWEGNITVPLAKDGHAEFLWNDQGVYVLLSGDYMFAHDPEAICLNITDFISSSNCPSIRLEMKSAGPMGPELVRMVRNGNWRDPLLPPFQDSLVCFSAHTFITKQHTPWSAEVFLPWQTLSSQGSPRGKLFIHVYRLMIERPTPVLIMERSTDTQQHTGAYRR